MNTIARTLAAALLWLLCGATARADVVLKVATLAPDGSSWMKLFRDFAARLSDRTGGRVKFKIYAGGVQGDELELLRKIRIGQLQGAAITGIGLQAITPEARVFDLARTNDELDAFRAVLHDEIEKRFAEKGYVIGGWGDVGPIHIFSNRPIRVQDDLRKNRFWIWSADPISKQISQAIGIGGVPLEVPEVLPSLQTGMIDAFLSTPLATLALQWQSQIKYMSTPALGTATGATILSKQAWDRIAPADQEVLRQEAAQMQQLLLRQVRADNVAAVETFKRQGIQLIELSPELRARFEAVEEQVARQNATRVSPAFATKIEKLVNDYRSGKITRQMMDDYRAGKITAGMLDDYLEGRISERMLDDYRAGRIKLEKRD
jgi:TRAP-type C4-dicarboxylate transport system substrate-binding protein